MANKMNSNQDNNGMRNNEDNFDHGNGNANTEETLTSTSTNGMIDQLCLTSNIRSGIAQQRLSNVMMQRQAFDSSPRQAIETTENMLMMQRKLKAVIEEALAIMSDFEEEDDD